MILSAMYVFTVPTVILGLAGGGRYVAWLLYLRCWQWCFRRFVSAQDAFMELGYPA